MELISIVVGVAFYVLFFFAGHFFGFRMGRRVGHAHGRIEQIEAERFDAAHRAPAAAPGVGGGHVDAGATVVDARDTLPEFRAPR